MIIKGHFSWTLNQKEIQSSGSEETEDDNAEGKDQLSNSEEMLVETAERVEAENAGSEEDEEKQAEGEIEDETVSAVTPYWQKCY